MRYLFSLLLVSLLCFACNRSSYKEDEIPLVRVGDKFLYQTDLDKVLYSGLSSEDSIIISEHFIRSWVNDQLLYDVALKNISNKEEVEKLVENYRHSLIVHQYQEQLINERLSREINEDSLLFFYEENKDRFKLDRPLIKGLFLKIPQGAPQIDKISTLYKTITPENIETIEKYSIQNSAVFDYFVDQWIAFDDLIDNWPGSSKDENDILKLNKYIEQQDSSYYYYLNVTEFLLPGESVPFEHTKSVIKEMLLNQKKNEFLKRTEEELYQRALGRGQIVFFNE
ncbi:peptidyl-prolyl cis-trans isomerase [Bacteroidales bacterium OttesenSCG-928-A17]|nr:peptidyl-prolyl cis-trans isomerase [Bacteroidales bacterium OttesenSCG-928-A17]